MTPAERLAEIEKLPESMRNSVVLDWSTVAFLSNAPNEDRARRNFKKMKVPLVAVNGREKLPRYGDAMAALAPQAA
jgi:hypothetical protein